MGEPKIKMITIFGPVGEYGEIEDYGIGIATAAGTVTDIRPTTRPGMHADIDYLQVWIGERLHAEFPRHMVQAVYYEDAQ